MNEFFLKIKEKIGKNRVLKAIFATGLPICCAVAIGLNALIEILARLSFTGTALYVLQHPFVFLYNALIILFTLTVCLLFKRRVFWLSLISVVWIGLGIGNFCVLTFRSTPLSAVDFSVAKFLTSMITTYLSIFQIVLIVAAIVTAGALLVLIFKKCRKHTIVYLRSLGAFAAVGLTVLATTSLFLATEATDDDCFSDLGEAYDEYGFVFGFTCSFLDIGIDCPDNYCEETMDELEEKLPYEEAEKAFLDVDELPDIVFLQLESFMDLKNLHGVTFSENPTPYFDSLKEEYPSGLLDVPSRGGGTANVEFEVLSEMTLDFFGPGEYPYQTVLKTTPAYSVCRTLSDLGYRCHALHTYLGTFYDRNIVYANLGFDTFTSIENMTITEYNPLGWAKDCELTEEISGALDSTEGSDFVFAVSVQGHGRYPDERKENDSHKIKVIENGTDVSDYALEYYANQLRESDEAIKEIKEMLDSRGKPYILVVYGDHQGAINISDDDISVGLFQSEYVIVSNTELLRGDAELDSSQLAAYTLSAAGLDYDLIPSLHIAYIDGKINEKEYREKLKLIQYDILYGESCVTDGIRFEKNILQMGYRQILIIGLDAGADGTTVRGMNFTEYSRIYINGWPVRSEYIDENTLLISRKTIDKGDLMFVKQITTDGTPLGVSKLFIVSEKNGNYELKE